MKQHYFLLIGSALLLNACVSTGDGNAASSVHLSSCVIQEPLPGKDVTGAFVDFHNGSSETIQLKAVEAPKVTQHVEIHEMVMKDHVMVMAKMDGYPLTPGMHQFKKGSYHVMLMDIPQAIHAGEEYELKFVYGDNSVGSCKATVKSVEDVNALYNVKEDMSGHDMHSMHNMHK